MTFLRFWRVNLVLLLSIALCLPTFVAGAATTKTTSKQTTVDATVVWNDEWMSNTLRLQTKNNVTYASLKALASLLGIRASVSNTNKVYKGKLTSDFFELIVQANSKKLTRTDSDGMTTIATMTAAPLYVSGQLYVPLKEIIANMGLKISIQKVGGSSASASSYIRLTGDLDRIIYSTPKPTKKPVTTATPNAVAGPLAAADFSMKYKENRISLFESGEKLDVTVDGLQKSELGTFSSNGLVYPGRLYQFPFRIPAIKLYQYLDPNSSDTFWLSITCTADCETSRGLKLGGSTGSTVVKLYGEPDRTIENNPYIQSIYKYNDHLLIFSRQAITGIVEQIEWRRSLTGLVKSADIVIPTMTPKVTGTGPYYQQTNPPMQTYSPFGTPRPTATIGTPYRPVTPEPKPTETPAPTETPRPTPSPTPTPTPTMALGATTKVLEQGNWIKDVSVNKSRFQPGDQVTVQVSLRNPRSSVQNGKLITLVRQQDRMVQRLESERITLNSNVNQEQSYSFTAPSTDYKGYSLDVFWTNEQEALDMRMGAFDVSSDWSRFPRYGYITDYPYMTSDQTKQVIDRLNRYHINAIQFYDWQWKHHQPVKMENGQLAYQWKEIANRDVYSQTIKQYISHAKSKNMLSMNYNLLFGAYDRSEVDGVRKDWGLFKKAWDNNREYLKQDAHCDPRCWPADWATEKILILNPANDGWRNYIANKEREVFQQFEFDGWHIDQLGSRGDLYDNNWNRVDLGQTYGPAIDFMKYSLNKRMVMNAVNEYGGQGIAQAQTDILYTEVWPDKNPSYYDLKRIIDTGSNWASQKGHVLAAYMNYEKSRKNETSTFNPASVLLTDAVIMAAGGSHLELGDTGMLANEYFPNNKVKMTDELSERLKKYYDFHVAYQNWTRDRVMPLNLRVEGEYLYSTERPQAGRIWSFSKQATDAQVVHLINLSGNRSVDWRDDYGTSVNEPTTYQYSMVRISTSRLPQSVYATSPDDDGRLVPLNFTAVPSNGSYVVEFRLPQLKLWSMIVMKE